MVFIFWALLIFILYTYLGYPLSVWITAKISPRPIIKSSSIQETPNVSVVIAARNEESAIIKKINNLYASDYPDEFLEIIIISDGSNDATGKVITEYQSANPDKNIHLIEFSHSLGKPSALNAGVEKANSEFIVFADCRQEFDSLAIRNLMQNFSDPDIGAVSGELMFRQSPDSKIAAEMGLYWRYEKSIRKNEAQSGSVVGATGAIYAIRKELYRPLPAEALVDDVLTPLNVVMQGKRVVFDSAALAYDFVSVDEKQEWRRKVRTLAGNWQLLEFNPELLNPFKNPIFWRLIGHKFSRLIVPFALIILFLTSVALPGTLFNLFTALQVLFYLAVGSAHAMPSVRKNRLFKFSYFVVVLNIAALFGFYYWVTKRCHLLWLASEQKTPPKNKIPILMYHALEDSENPAGFDNMSDQVYVVNTESFRKQMACLKADGFKTLLIDELLALERFPDKVVVLTFDDGHRSNWALACQILKEFGFKAEFFITTDRINTQDFLTESEIRALAEAGMGIGSHGVTHRFLNDLSGEDVLFELNGSYSRLAGIIGRDVSGISFPGGRIPEVPIEKYAWCCTSRVDYFEGEGTALPRFALKHDTSLSTFKRIIHCDPMIARKAKARYLILKAIKKLLGNNCYSRLHRYLVR